MEKFEIKVPLLYYIIYRVLDPIAGIFGMNLPHGLEEHPTAFYVTCAGVSAMMLALFSTFRIEREKQTQTFLVINALDVKTRCSNFY